MFDVMLDLETLSSRPDAAIVAIGAVEFDLDALTLGREFYLLVDLHDAVATGGVMDPGTVLWWLDQPAEARRELTAPRKQRYEMTTALWQFSAWLGERMDKPRVWGNGADLDNVVLGSAYRRCVIPLPWSFRDNRCFRTVRALGPEVPWRQPPGTVRHRADHDAKSQAQHLLDIAARLRGMDRSLLGDLAETAAS